MTDPNWWTIALEDLRAEVREASGRRIAVVTFDLPGRRNAMSTAMTQSWVRLMEGLREDPDLAAVVVTGAPPAFNAGGDLSWIVSEPDAQVVDLRRRMLAFYRSWLSIKDLEVPTIAAINGHAIGAGFALALACDIRYAAADAKLGVPFTSLGLHPGMATTWSLPDVAGPAVARDLLLTGRIVTGEEAVTLGLVSRAVPADEVLGEALAAAERVAAAAPIATRLTLQAVRDGGHASYATALEWEALAQAVTLASEDLHEGIAAAAERRTPTFHGR
ncbi:MAG TPA: enoyl-CoA hydratase-related protein [Pedococcus sp.]|nr:enoyl-CoA hydratase-related protein [Pedococcus sp.]